MEHCTDAQYEVVAAVRRPETIADKAGIQIRTIDLQKHETLVSALEGVDVLVSCIGHGSVKAASRPTDLYSRSTRNYLRAMRDAGVNRIIVLSSGGVVQDSSAPWYYRHLLRPYLINTYTDMARMEGMLETAPDIEWTALRLTYLRDGPSRPYLVKDQRIEEGNFQIHFTDVGKFIADEIGARQWINRQPVIGYAT